MQSNTYHCSLSAIAPEAQHVDTGPYKSVSELVTMTGLPYGQWLERQAALREMNKRDARKRVTFEAVNAILE